MAYVLNTMYDPQSVGGRTGALPRSVPKSPAVLMSFSAFEAHHHSVPAKVGSASNLQSAAGAKVIDIDRLDKRAHLISDG